MFSLLCREAAVPCILAADLQGTVENGDRVVLDLSDRETARISKAAAVTV